MFPKFGEILSSHLSLKKSKISPPEVQIIDYSSYIIMAKKRRNITGLRNQSKTASHAIEEVRNDSIEAIEMPATNQQPTL